MPETFIITGKGPKSLPVFWTGSAWTFYVEESHHFLEEYLAVMLSINLEVNQHQLGLVDRRYVFSIEVMPVPSAQPSTGV